MTAFMPAGRINSRQIINNVTNRPIDYSRLLRVTSALQKSRQFGLYPTFNINPTVNIPLSLNANRRSSSNFGGNNDDNGSEGSDKGNYLLKSGAPAPVSWDSGLNHVMTPEFRTGGDIHSSCMYAASGEFCPDNTKTGSKDSVVTGLTDQMIGRYWSTIVASNDSVTSADKLKTPDLMAYFRLIITGLSYFYAINSMLVAFDNNTAFNNRAIDYFRSRLTTKVSYAYSLLETELKRHYLPPKLYSFIRYMYQNFCFSLEPGSPVYRLFPGALAMESPDGKSIEGSIESDILSDIVKELQSEKYSKVINILARNFSDLRIPLEESYNVPIYSQSFMTFWTNQSVNYFNPIKQTDVTNTRSLSNDDNSFLYFMDNEVIDMAYLSLTPINIDNKHMHGLWKPLENIEGISDETYTNVLRFADGRFQGNIPEQLTSGCGIATVPVLKLESGDFEIYTRILPGFRKAQFITPELINRMGLIFGEYLFMTRSDKDISPSEVSSNSKKRKRKSK